MADAQHDSAQSIHSVYYTVYYTVWRLSTGERRHLRYLTINRTMHSLYRVCTVWLPLLTRNVIQLGLFSPTNASFRWVKKIKLSHKKVCQTTHSYLQSKHITVLKRLKREKKTTSSPIESLWLSNKSHLVVGRISCRRTRHRR